MGVATAVVLIETRRVRVAPAAPAVDGLLVPLARADMAPLPHGTLLPLLLLLTLRLLREALRSEV